MTTSESRIVGALEAVRRRERVARVLRFSAAATLWIGLCVAWGKLAGAWYASLFALAGLALIAVVAVAIPLRTATRRLGTPRQRAALRIEQRVPSFRNVLVTAAELIDGTLRTSPAFYEAVMSNAETGVTQLSPAVVVPLRGALQMLLLCSGSAAVLLGLLPQSVPVAPAESANAARQSIGTLSSPSHAVTVTLTPPAYLGAPRRVLQNPERLDMVLGTAVEASANGAGLRWTAQDAARETATAALRFVPMEEGFITVERGDEIVRVIPVSVRPDETPKVTIETPAGDLRLAAAAQVPVAARARDDHALTSAELRYTRVSGSGEQFEFDSGVLPMEAATEARNAWSLRAVLPLGVMRSSPGDTIVFRIAARDGRDARGEGLSDAVVIEIAAPGAALIAGGAVDPAEDKFALSQQMILLRLRQLHARRGSLSSDDLLARSQDLAAQQRSVRALFVFMLGGEIEDEEVEAAHSHEIQEGRLEDAGRRDLVVAINLMSRVEQRLTAAQTGVAIPLARAAVDAVQRAFGRRRYFLRTTPIRMRIDPSRRLTGDTSTAGSLVVPFSRRPAPSPRLQAMEGLIALTSTERGGLTRGCLAAAAERVLRVEPGAVELQRIAAALQQVDPASSAEVRDAVSRALATLSAREQAVHPGRLQADPAPGRLKSAWSDAWRAGGSR